MSTQPAIARDVALVSSQGLFDAGYYVQQAPSLAGQPVVELIRHYLDRGWTENLDPHPLFLTKFYLEINNDVRKARVNPLAHYLKYGSDEGRTPHPLFSAHYYKAHYVKGNGVGLSALAHYLKIGVPADFRPNEFFVPEYYRNQLKQRRVSVRYLLDHYAKMGWRDGIATSPFFDTGFYLEANPDVRASTLNPLQHYLVYGMAEGRPGSPLDARVRRTQDVTYSEWSEIQRYLLPAQTRSVSHEAGVIDLAVVVSIHNAAPESVAACLESLWNQYCRGGRLILFDQGTTSAGVRKIIDDYLRKDPAIRTLLPVGSNQAWQESLAANLAAIPDYLLHLDCTELLAHDGIARVKSAIAAHPGGKFFAMSSTAQRLRQKLDWPSTMVIHRDLLDLSGDSEKHVALNYALLPSSVEEPLTYREYLRLTRGAGAGRAVVDWSKPHPLEVPKRKTVDVFVHSAGNFIFIELADLLASAFRELGWTSTRCDEKAYSRRKATLNVVVAPHEFFVLSNSRGKRRPIPGNTILFNTEQPWTDWFRKAARFFPDALKIWDMDYSSYRRLVSFGYDCDYLPLGSLQAQSAPREIPELPQSGRSIILPESTRRFSCLSQPWDRRPIDILYLGGMSSKRSEFFARNAAHFHRHQCYLHFADNSEPVVVGKNTEMTSLMTVGLIQRSKILLNVHRADELYFEWHRIVMLGLANEALVLTEPCTRAVPFVDGVDFIAAELETFPEILESLLTTTAGREKAKSIAAAGQRRFYAECKIQSHLSALLQKL